MPVQFYRLPVGGEIHMLLTGCCLDILTSMTQVLPLLSLGTVQINPPLTPQVKVYQYAQATTEEFN